MTEAGGEEPRDGRGRASRDVGGGDRGLRGRWRVGRRDARSRSSTLQLRVRRRQPSPSDDIPCPSVSSPMAVILEDEPAAAADVEQVKVPSPPPALPALVEALQPPALLPPPHDDRSFASLDGLDAWRSSFERTVDRLAELLEADVAGLEPAAGEALAAALSRWVPAEAAEEQEGWVLEQRVRANVSRASLPLRPSAFPPCLDARLTAFLGSPCRAARQAPAAGAPVAQAPVPVVAAAPAVDDIVPRAAPAGPHRRRRARARAVAGDGRLGLLERPPAGYRGARRQSPRPPAGRTGLVADPLAGRSS